MAISVKFKIDPQENGLILAAVLFLSALILYCGTIAPTISWGDSADLAMRLVYSGDNTFIGTYRDYALWRWVGQVAALLPFADAGLRANLFTAFWGAITVGAVTWLVHTITRSSFGAIVSGVALAVSHTFWLDSVIALPFTFNGALVILTYVFVSRWWYSGNSRWLWAGAIIGGLALTHMATGLILAVSIIPLFVAMRKRIKPFDFVISLVLWVASSFLYWKKTIPLLFSGERLLVALGLSVPQNAFHGVSVVHAAMGLSGYIVYNFVGLSGLLGVVGGWLTVRKRIWILLPPTIWVAAFVYAGLTSSIPDKQNVYVLINPVFAVFVGVGAAWLVTVRYSLAKRQMTLIVFAVSVFPVAVYFTTAKIASTRGLNLTGARLAPFRDNDLFYLWPPKNGDYGAREFAQSALDHVSPGGILVADYTLWRPIYFLQAVEGIRPDVKLVFVERLLPEGVTNWIASQSCQHAIFLATNHPGAYYQLNSVRARYNTVKIGPLLRVERGCQPHSGSQ